MFWGGKSKKAQRNSKPQRKSRGSRKVKYGKKLNEYFELMLNAKKQNLDEFKYKGKTYKKTVTKTGLVTYKGKK